MVLKFGIPAILAAFIGAKALLWLADLSAIATYQLGGQEFQITPVNLVIGILMILFAAIELIPEAKNFSLNRKFLPMGGVLSGFFGGMSGHQGALRTVFLLRCGLSKEGFIATGVVIACLIDTSRLFVYSERFTAANLNENIGLLIAASLTAFVGAYVGRLLMKKVTMRAIQILVSIMLFILAIALISGII